MQRGGWRSVLSAVAGLVAVAGLAGAAVGAWTLGVATDSDRFEEQVAEVLQREDVSDALARRVVADITAAFDVRAQVADLLPGPLAPAVDALAGGVRARVEDALAEQLRTDPVNAAVASAAGFAHRRLVDVLAGDGLADGLSIGEGEVRVNLLPVYATGFEQLQHVGLLRGIEIPDLDRGGDPADQRAQLAEALGRELPDDFGEPVVYRSESLADAGRSIELAQRALVLAHRLVWVLATAGVLATAASIWQARARLRVALFLVAGLFAVALAVRRVGGRAVDAARDAVVDPGAKVAVGEILEPLARSLERSLLAFAVAALAVVGIAAWGALRRGPSTLA